MCNVDPRSTFRIKRKGPDRTAHRAGKAIRGRRGSSRPDRCGELRCRGSFDKPTGKDSNAGSSGIGKGRFQPPFFLDGDTTGFELNHPSGELSDPWRCLVGRDTSDVDVGDQVPAGVVVAGPWPVCHVGREALGGCQPWSFTDQENGDGWIKDLANIVERAHAAVPDEKRLTESPASAAGLPTASRGSKAGTWARTAAADSPSAMAT